MKTVDFSDTIAASDPKVGRSRHLIELELFFYKKQMSPPLGNQKNQNITNKITNITEIMLIFQANNPVPIQ